MSEKISDLKKKNDFLEILEEYGYRFEKSGINGKMICPDHPGLIFDQESERYRWEKMRESGDVIDWLKARNGWSVSQAANYLRFRAMMPAEKRPRIEIKSSMLEDPSSIKYESEFSIEIPKDRRIKTALQKAADYPGFIKLLQEDPVSVVLNHKNYIPSMFLAIIGDWSDLDCSFCGHEFSGWLKDGSAYLSVDLGNDYEFIKRPKQAGVYCGQCLRTFERWNEAFDLLISFLREIRR